MATLNGVRVPLVVMGSLLVLASWLIMQPGMAEADAAAHPPAMETPAGKAHSDAETATRAGEVVPGRYIVIFEGNTDQPRAIARAQVNDRGGRLGFVYRAAFDGYSATGLSQQDATALRGLPSVKRVIPDRRIEAEAQTIPTGISRISALTNEALDIDGADDVRVNADVAVIDTGIDQTHPDLNVVGRVNCVPIGEEPVTCVSNSGTDVDGHGTHVAGIIGAIDNGIGVVGTAPGVRLWSVRVLGDEGWGYTSWVLAGIDWVTANAATIEVANMSLGGPEPELAMGETIRKSIEAGVVVAVSAGNGGVNVEGWHPSNFPDPIGVSALMDWDGQPGGLGAPKICANWGGDDELLKFSNWGKGVDIAAPGGCIYSTSPGGKYKYLSGTSMAAPHVAGAAAVLAAKSNPNNQSAVDAIRNSLVEGGSLNWTDSSQDGEPEPLLYLGGQPLTKTEVATGGWSNESSESATVYGSVNPRGLATTYSFEYGTTSQYGQSMLLSPKSVGSTSYTVVNETIQGLKRGQTYHYRLTATNASGTFVGQDRTMTISRWANKTGVSRAPGSIEDDWRDLTCTAPGQCRAVDTYWTTDYHAGAYALSGGTWSFEPLAAPSGSTSARVNGISCSAAAACTAVGTVYVEGKFVPLVSRLSGGPGWSAQSVPPPYAGAPDTGFEDVSCWSATGCMAVGEFKNSAGDYVNYAARWNGSSWINVIPPNPAPSGERSVLEGVHCVGDQSCVAVGWYNSGEGARPSIARWNGSWSLDTPVREFGWLSGIDCSSKDACAAVGGGYDNYSVDVEAWDGAQWAQQTVDQPAEGGELESVDCSSASACTAVGVAWIGERRSGLIETFDGSEWSVQTGVRRAEAGDRLRGVACTGLAGCVAVGWFSQDYPGPLVELRDNVATGPASNVTPSTATVTGTVHPIGKASTFFEYGKTTAYGSKVAGGTFGDGASARETSVNLSELEAETTYHYRAIATNSSGTVYGPDRTFRTTSPAPVYQFSFGVSGAGPGQFDDPVGVTLDPGGNLWVADSGNDRIQKFDTKGTYSTQFGTPGSANGQLQRPVDIAFPASGSYMWVSDAENNRVQKLSPSGAYLGKFGSGGTGNGQFTEPWGLDVGPNGNIWVTDSRYYRVEEFGPNGEFVRQVGSGSGSGNGQFLHPEGLDIDQAGDVWIADSTNDRVQVLSSTGEYRRQFGSKGTGAGQFNETSALVVKSSGNVLVTDYGNGRVEEFGPAGEYLQQFGSRGTGTGQLRNPGGIAVDASGGIYVADTSNDRIQKWQIPQPPAATTKAASSVGAVAATLNATVNPNGYASSYRIEYGPTTAYGWSAPLASQGVGSGSAGVAVSQTIGADPETTYHYRVVATSPNGTTYGKDMTFTTATVMSDELNAMPVVESFDGGAESLARFATDWSPLGWASGANPKGSNTATGWRVLDASPAVNGAYYEPTISYGGEGIAAAATLSSEPLISGRYVSLWLDASGSASSRSGYELRMTATESGTYNVALSKWQSGSQVKTVTKNGYAFPVGGSFALVDGNTEASAWMNTGSGYTKLLSFADSAFNSGNAALEGVGNLTRITKFKAGVLPGL